MSKSESEIKYKEILKNEVNRIPEHDFVFIIKIITLIRKHLEKTGKQ